ncbi:NUDIX domain-containing protein [Iocasia frigidifontis]|uniref:NUDIX domain-containing protein n=1 Tax=Iocasia fonsfrigidae TaxID=2682810 RepID=A0A8A7KCB2_9FIRM|nr:CoA pyrophosphatase [Iocasia fonsfrigidae]QTL97228.1 NUDIX domain-containing protein [Iocasia fonsfrigidae]
MNRCDLQKVVAKLPEYPGIIGKEEIFFNSAVLIPLLEIAGEYHFLFEVRAGNIRQGNEICFPGGKYEPDHDANYQEAAVRETVEELGIPREKIIVKGELGTFLAPMGASIDSFLAVLKIKDTAELMINKKEVKEVFTAPVSFFRDNSPEEYKVRLEIQPFFKDENGREEIYLPAKDLGLPERYHKPWGGKRYDIILYRYQEKIIWGITAQLVRGFINLL